MISHAARHREAVLERVETIHFTARFVVTTVFGKFFDVITQNRIEPQEISIQGEYALGFAQMIDGPDAFTKHKALSLGRTTAG